MIPSTLSTHVLANGPSSKRATERVVEGPGWLLSLMALPSGW